MDRFGERLRASMLARGLEPTPENLARLCEGLITPEEAGMLMSIKSLPRIFQVVGFACRKLQVRMIWLTSGQTIPQITGALRPEDIDALDILAGMDEEEARRWIKLGKRLSRI